MVKMSFYESDIEVSNCIFQISFIFGKGLTVYILQKDLVVRFENGGALSCKILL